MKQLLPFFHALPPLLFVYGIMMAVANVAELRATASISGMEGSLLSDMRIAYLAGIVRSFYELFFFWGMAAIVTASNKYLEGQV